MKDKNIIDMSLKTGNASMRGSENALLEAVEFVQENPEFKKCLVLMLNDSDGYQICWFNAGMKLSEMIALTRIAESNILEHMDH